MVCVCCVVCALCGICVLYICVCGGGGVARECGPVLSALKNRNEAGSKD